MSHRSRRTDARDPAGCAALHRRARTLVLFLLLGIAAAHPGSLQAQVEGGSGGGNRIEGRAKFLPLPYVGYNRTLGWAVGALPGVLFNPFTADTISPSSFAGAAAIYTGSESWAVGGFVRLYLAEDRWRVSAVGMSGSANLQFYLELPLDVWVDYTTVADVARVIVERRVWQDLFLGVGYQYLGFETTLDLIDIPVETKLHGFQVAGAWDRRSSVTYPSSGFVSNVRYTAYPDWMGNDASSSVVTADYVRYMALRGDRDVLTGRVYVGLGIGDVSFNQQFVVGGTDIRGYSQGKYRGDNLLAVQSEYRWNILPRFGLVGFAGFAWLFDAVNEDHDG
ncbi:MAG: BamA/TamA family outer membrane protein, partial [Gemmatimonadota bacterium]